MIACDRIAKTALSTSDWYTPNNNWDQDTTMTKDDGLNELRKCFQPWQWFMDEGEPNSSMLNDEVIFMWVYRAVKDQFQVGYFMPDGTWFTDASYPNKDAAAKRVNYLNGGHIRERGGE